MAYKVQKPCRVCGKMYTPCADCENDKVVFRWRTVACSPECGKEYFRRILESRAANKSRVVKDEKVDKSAKITTSDNGMDNVAHNDISEKTKAKTKDKA